MIRTAAVLLAFFTAATAYAQRPIFDPDDFLDPGAADGRPVLISRLVIGAASNMNGDGFRPIGEHVGYVHLATSFSWRNVQFDYKRSQLKAEDGEAAQWQITEKRTCTPDGNALLCTVSRSAQETRQATPKSKDTLHAAWYWPISAGGTPVMLRSRATYTTQPIETSVITNQVRSHLSGSESTFALDTDTYFRLAGHSVFGSLAVSQTKTTGTNADRDERAITYTNRFPAFSFDWAKIVVRPTLAVGGISNRGSSGVNLVNPAIELFRPFARTGANLHVIWSPQWAAKDKEWKVTHQVAVLIDRALFVKVF